MLWQLYVYRFVFKKDFLTSLKKIPNNSFSKEQVGTVVRNTFVGVHKTTSKALQGGDKFSVLLCLERKVFSQEELQALGLFPKFPLQISSLSLESHVPLEFKDCCFPFFQHPEPQQGCNISRLTPWLIREG